MTSHGAVSKRTWVHRGVKQSAWQFTARVNGQRVRRSGFLSRAEAQEALDAAKNPTAPVVEPVVSTSPMTLSEAFERYFQAKARKKESQFWAGANSANSRGAVRPRLSAKKIGRSALAAGSGVR